MQIEIQTGGRYCKCEFLFRSIDKEVPIWGRSIWTGWRRWIFHTKRLIEEKRKLLCATPDFLCATPDFFMCHSGLFFAVLISLADHPTQRGIRKMEHPNFYVPLRTFLCATPGYFWACWFHQKFWHCKWRQLGLTNAKRANQQIQISAVRKYICMILTNPWGARAILIANACQNVPSPRSSLTLQRWSGGVLGQPFLLIISLIISIKSIMLDNN